MNLDRLEANHTFTRVKVSLLVLSVLFLSNRVIAANCSWLGATARWNHYYNGLLMDGEAVRAVLSFRGCAVTGTWFDSILFTDLSVTGRITQDGSVTLTLHSRSRTIHEQLRGRLLRRNFFLRDSHSVMNVDSTESLIGKLTGSAGLNGQTVSLFLSRLWNGTAANVGIPNLAAFNHATLIFWRAVQNHNVSVVAHCVRYPLHVWIVYLKGNTYKSRSLLVTNSAMLRRDYNEIFNQTRRSAILTHLPRHLMAGVYAHTIALDGGAVVFNLRGQVIALH